MFLGFLVLDPLSTCLTLLIQNLIRIKWSAHSRIKGNTVYVYVSFSTVKCSMIQGQWCGKSPDLFILPNQTGYRMFYGCGQRKSRTISHVTASWVCAAWILVCCRGLRRAEKRKEKKRKKGEKRKEKRTGEGKMYIRLSHRFSEAFPKVHFRIYN